jgi:hypothetical protein
MSARELLSLIEASERLDVSPHQVVTLFEDGVLAGERVGRTVMFRPEVVAALHAEVVPPT